MSATYSIYELLTACFVAFCTGGGLGISAMCIVHMNRDKGE